MTNSSQKILFFLFLLFTITSCTVPIGVIKKHPKLFDNRKVRVRGKVVNSLKLEDLRLFTIKGAGGKKIDVITNGYLPMVGDILVVKGRVHPSYKYHRRRLFVIEEKFKSCKKRGRRREKIKYKYIKE